MDRLREAKGKSAPARLAPGVSEWLTSPVGPIGLCLAFVLGQARLVDGPAVIAVAYYAALTGLGIRWLPMVGVALTLGFGWVRVPDAAAEIYSLMGALTLVHLLAKFTAGAPFRRPVAVGGLAAMGITAFHLLRGLGPGGGLSAMLPFEVGLAVVVAMVMAPGPQAIRRGRPFALEEQVSLTVIGLAALGGALGLAGVWTWAAVAVGGFVLLRAANQGGHAGGAVAGAVLGLACLVFGASPALERMSVALAFVMGGLVAGLFRSLGRWVTALALVLTAGIVLGLMLARANPFYLVGALAMGALLGCAIITDVELLPVRREVQEPAADHAQVRQRIASLSRLFTSLHKSFDEVAAHAPVDPAASGLTQSLASVHDAVCKTCSLQNMCWEQDVFRTYQGLQRLWDALEDNDTHAVRNAAQDFGRRCVAADRVAAVLSTQHERRRSERAWSLRLAEGRYVMTEYMQQIGRLLGRLADDLEPGGPVSQGEPRLAVRVHIASAAKGVISGDGILETPLPDGRYLVMLSDGMGHGPEAAEQSRQAIRLVHQMLAAGFSSEVAVQTVNAVLLLHSPGESFATVDLALIDLVSGRTEITKVGAPPTLLKRGREVFRVTGVSAPVGIVGGVRPDSQVRYLRPGDCLVMCTDGLWDRLEKTQAQQDWLEESLRRAQNVNPAPLAESLVSAAIPQGEPAPDDVTVVIVTVTGGAEHAGDWQPARRALVGRTQA
jgi:stage II sporulation protein E